MRYEGHDGVRDFWRDFMAPWESLWIEFTEVRELGENAIVVRVLFRGRGRGGIEVERDFGQYYGIEDGLLHPHALLRELGGGARAAAAEEES